VALNTFSLNIHKCLTQWLLFGMGCVALVCLAGCSAHSSGMLNPKGIIAYQQRRLFFDTIALMLIVVLPVIVMSFTFVYHYQISHRTREYKPNWAHSYFLESLWWGIPCVIILVLAILTWKKTQELDPFNPIPSANPDPMRIQVIGLPWKWLFIYPEQHIATLNYLVIPVGKPVEYWITVDNVPMSAFMIPQLGSQIYTMAGMRSRLNLIADQVGIFRGLNTNFNGDGFSDMHFDVYVVDAAAMQQWVTRMQGGANHLTDATYHDLLKPSIGEKPQFFSGVSSDLFQRVLMTYMNSLGRVHPRDQAGTSWQERHEE
jgi:cytochrome o ubiquinol oxidase subunit II